MTAIGRNAPCPCGSGLRYKSCHGAVTVPGAVATGPDPLASDPKRTMATALQAHQSGDLARAEALYREALRQIPGEPDCLHMLGVVCYQTSRYREAAEWVLRAAHVTGGPTPAMGVNLRLIASRLLDEPVFWDAGPAATAEALFALPAGSPEMLAARPLGEGAAIRVLVIDQAIPQPDRDSGSMRMAAILRLLRGIGCRVAYFAVAMDYEPGRDAWLQELGIEVIHGPQYWAGTSQVLAALGGHFDLIVVSRLAVALPCMTMLRHFAPYALFAFDTVDLHYLRLQREAQLGRDPCAAAYAAIVRQQELGIIRSADLTFVVSEAERSLLAHEVPQARIDLLSNVHEVSVRTRGFDERRDVFFVGGFAHAPNVDAMHWYAAEIWPRIRGRLPDLRTYVVGSDMPESVVALATDGIVAVGHAAELHPWLDGCRIAIAPLRYGAGVKGKVTVALAAGVPVVATPMAAEGMHLTHERDALLADTAEAFADAVVRLHEDRRLWTSISDAGQLTVGRHFAPGVAQRTLEAVRDQARVRRQSRLVAPARTRASHPRRPALVLVPAGYGSLGDEAMVRGLAAGVSDLAEEWDLDLLSVYGGSHWPCLPGINRVIDLHPAPPADAVATTAKIATIASGYDAFALIGADVLDGYYSPEESVQRLNLVPAASGQGRATAILNCSVNENLAPIALAGIVAACVHGPLFARDPVSQRRLVARQVGNVMLAADLAFLMPPAAPSASTGDSERWIRSQRSAGRRVIVCSLSTQVMQELRHGGNDHLDDLAAVMATLIDGHHVSIVWIAHDLRRAAVPGESDGELAASFSRRIAQRIRSDAFQALPPPLAADEVKYLVGKVDLVVTARMHAAIAAFGMGRPVVGIGYQGKFTGLWESFGSAGTLFEARSLDCRRLLQACVDTLAHEREIATRLQARLPAVVALARQQVSGWLGLAVPQEAIASEMQSEPRR